MMITILAIQLFILLLVGVNGQPDQGGDNIFIDHRPHGPLSLPEIVIRPRGCPFEFQCDPCFVCVQRECIPALICPHTQHCEPTGGQLTCVSNDLRRCGMDCGPCGRCNRLTGQCMTFQCPKCQHCEGGRCVRDNTVECQIVQPDPCNRPNAIHIPGC